MDDYHPQMSHKRVELLRNWHERGASELNGARALRQLERSNEQPGTSVTYATYRLQRRQ